MGKNKILFFIILFLCSIIFSSCGQNDKMLSEQGVIDLRETDFFKEKKIKLTGKWKSYEKEIDFISGDSKTAKQYMILPNIEGNIIEKNKETKPLMLSLKLESLAPGDLYSLKIPYIFGNYKLFINGRMLTYQYRGEKHLYTKAKYLEFHSEDTIMDIKLQIFPVQNFKPGLKEEIIFGARDKVLLERDFNIILNYMVITLLLISIFYYFYIMHKNDGKNYIKYIILASGCGIIFQIVNFSFIELNYTFREKFKYIIIIMIIFFVFSFFIRFFSIKAKKTNYKNIQKMIVAIIVLSTFMPYRFSGYWGFLEGIIIIIFMYIILLNILSFIKKRKNAFINLLSYIFVFTVIILYKNESLNQTLLNLGVFFFVLSQFFIFIRKNYSVPYEVETVVGYNKEMLKQYQDLNENFEIKLKERTQDLEAKNNFLKKMITIDGLTGLYNHKYVYDILESEYKKAIRYKKPLTVIMIDIDHFKNINDNYGHQIGDQILISVAKILKQMVRETDVVGRCGGEEFMIVLCETDLEGAYTLAERIRLYINKNKFTADDVKVSISAGIAQLEDEKSPKDIVKNADDLLYKAKHNGRNRIEI